MSSPPSPPEPPIPPPPDSRTRPFSAFDACTRLSRDGAAAVLGHAWLLFEVERRRTPHLRVLDLYDFSRRVLLAVKETKDGLYRGDRIFLAAAYRVLRARGETEGMTLGAFKERLVNAHHSGWLMLSTSRKFRGANPVMVAASAVRSQRRTFHMVHRFSHDSVHLALTEVMLALPKPSIASVAAYAAQVLDDERLRQGQPRLITLSPDAFAARVQTIADRYRRDVPLVELFLKLVELGEATGLGLEGFRARIRAAARTGKLSLGEAAGDSGTIEVVRRSNTPLPIPWGPPAPMIPPRRASFA